MKKIRVFSISFMIMVIIAGMCGCTSNHNSNRQETDQEYILLMQEYIQEKYSITVNIAEQILPQEGFNTALEENILVVWDADGVIANVRARLSTPYDFYDDYIESCITASIQKELDVSVPSGDAKIYVALNNKTIDASAENIAALTFVSTITGNPDEDVLESLYEIYNNIQENGYDNVSFLVGFTDGSAEFEKAVENYTVYGKSEWKDYSGEVFAELYVTDNNLAFDEFKQKVNYELE